MHFRGWTTNVRLSAVGIVLLIIALIIWGVRTSQNPEDLPNWLPWAFWASWIGGWLFTVAGGLMRARAAINRLRDSRASETVRILLLAFLSFVLGIVCNDRFSALEHPFGPIQSIFYAVIVAVLLFLLIRGAWKRDA